jgi:hypothetical protein
LTVSGRWQANTESQLDWNTVPDPVAGESFVSARANTRRLTRTTTLGDERYWEWFGTLESDVESLPPDFETSNYATLGLLFSIGDDGYAVLCTRFGDGAKWIAEIMRRVPGTDELRRLAPPRSIEFVEPEDTVDDYRACFSVKRLDRELHLQVGEFHKPPQERGKPAPAPVETRQEPYVVKLPEGVDDVQLTLFCDQGRGEFRVKRR